MLSPAAEAVSIVLGPGAGTQHRSAGNPLFMQSVAPWAGGRDGGRPSMTVPRPRRRVAFMPPPSCSDRIPVSERVCALAATNKEVPTPRSSPRDPASTPSSRIGPTHARFSLRRPSAVAPSCPDAPAPCRPKSPGPTRPFPTTSGESHQRSGLLPSLSTPHGSPRRPQACLRRWHGRRYPSRRCPSRELGPAVCASATRCHGTASVCALPLENLFPVFESPTARLERRSAQAIQRDP